jgi:ribosome-binding factor A
MTGKRRLARLQEDIQRELAAIVEFESRDPVVRNAFPTVMDVRLSTDARHAKVYVAVGTDVDSVEFHEALVRDQGFYRSELAHRLSVRHTPELQFIVDRTVERSLRLEKLLQDGDDAGSG